MARHNSCREEEPETATHSLLMISTLESGIRNFQLKAVQEAVLIYLDDNDYDDGSSCIGNNETLTTTDTTTTNTATTSDKKFNDDDDDDDASENLMITQ